MPCKFVSHIKCPLKGSKLEEEAGRRGSCGSHWLAMLPHSSSLMVAALGGTGESWMWCIVARMDTRGGLEEADYLLYARLFLENLAWSGFLADIIMPWHGEPWLSIKQITKLSVAYEVQTVLTGTKKETMEGWKTQILWVCFSSPKSFLVYSTSCFIYCPKIIVTMQLI